MPRKDVPLALGHSECGIYLLENTPDVAALFLAPKDMDLQVMIVIEV